jgi:hypothetical protein
VNHTETKDGNPLFLIFHHKEPPFLSFHSPYTVYPHRIRELFGRFLKNGFECTLDGTGYRDFAHLNKPIKGLRQVPHPLNAQVCHNLPLQGSKPMTAPCTDRAAPRPFAGFQTPGNMKTDSLYFCLKTFKIPLGLKLNDTST